MKKDFSTHWKKSRQPRKQRKYLYNAPLHLRHKLLAANLSKELRKKYGKRSFQLRKGDGVKIIRGKFKGRIGKINTIDLKRAGVSVEGIQIQKKDGTKVNVHFNPSNLQIRELILEDRERTKKLGKEEWKTKEKGEKKEEKVKGEKNALKKK